MQNIWKHIRARKSRFQLISWFDRLFVISFDMRETKSLIYVNRETSLFSTLFFPTLCESQLGSGLAHMVLPNFTISRIKQQHQLIREESWKDTSWLSGLSQLEHNQFMFQYCL